MKMAEKDRNIRSITNVNQSIREIFSKPIDRLSVLHMWFWNTASDLSEGSAKGTEKIPRCPLSGDHSEYHIQKSVTGIKI